MKRLMAFLAGLVMITTALFAGAGAAQADSPLTVYAGLKITPTIEYEGHCTLGAVGYDDSGRKIGLTAGHCRPTADTPVPIPVYDHATKDQFGTIVKNDTRKSHDWAVIVIDDDVNISSTAPNGFRVDGLGGSGSAGRIYGATSGIRTGTISVITPGDVGHWIPVQPGDSGGPLVRGTKLTGIINRIDYLAFFSVGSQFVSVNINRVIADINSTATDFGKGFEPVNN